MNRAGFWGLAASLWGRLPDSPPTDWIDSAVYRRTSKTVYDHLHDRYDAAARAEEKA